MDEKLLERLKNKYWTIYKTEVLGIDFIWRELSRAEYDKALRFYPDSYDREEYVCRLCIVEPKNYDYSNCEAGIPTTLVTQILRESGFSTEPTGKIEALLSERRKEMENFQFQVSCIIQEAFPTKDIDDIDNWPLEKTLWYLSRAEYILNNLRGMQISATQEQNAVAPGVNVNSGDMNDFPELKRQQEFLQGKKDKRR